MIIIGLFFTFMSLLVLGASTTKGNSDGTVTDNMSAHMMEKADDKPAADY